MERLEIQKGYFTSCRLNKAERKALVTMARREYRTLSEMMRICIREGAQKRNLAPLGTIRIAENGADGRAD